MNDWGGLTLRCDETADGETNMRLDTEMLERAETGQTEIRIYRWDQAWVSLGANQEPLEIDLPQVRRPTGGRAVLHGDDVTISIAMPLRLIGVSSLQLRSIYRFLIEPMIEAFRECGLPVETGESQTGENRVGGNRLDCFASMGTFDLAIIDSTGVRQKVGGAALKTSQAAALLQVSVLERDSAGDGPFAARTVPEWRHEDLMAALRESWSRRVIVA
jgi:lipoate-protein ligase A